jgi:hypothetical protein
MVYRRTKAKKRSLRKRSTKKRRQQRRRVRKYRGGDGNLHKLTLLKDNTYACIYRKPPSMSGGRDKDMIFTLNGTRYNPPEEGLMIAKLGDVLILKDNSNYDSLSRGFDPDDDMSLFEVVDGEKYIIGGNKQNYRILSSALYVDPASKEANPISWTQLFGYTPNIINIVKKDDKFYYSAEPYKVDEKYFKENYRFRIADRTVIVTTYVKNDDGTDKEETKKEANPGDIIISGPNGENFVVTRKNLRNVYTFLDAVNIPKEILDQDLIKAGIIVPDQGQRRSFLYRGMDTLTFKPTWWTNEKPETMNASPGAVFIIEGTYDGGDGNYPEGEGKGLGIYSVNYTEFLLTYGVDNYIKLSGVY